MRQINFTPIQELNVPIKDGRLEYKCKYCGADLSNPFDRVESITLRGNLRYVFCQKHDCMSKNLDEIYWNIGVGPQ